MTLLTRMIMMVLLGLATSCSSPESARCRVLAESKERYCSSFLTMIEISRGYYSRPHRMYDAGTLGIAYPIRAVVRIGTYCAPAHEEAIRDVAEALVAVNGYLAVYYNSDEAEVDAMSTAAMGLGDHLITLISQRAGEADGCHKMMEPQREHCQSYVSWLQAMRERYAAGWTHTGMLTVGGEEDVSSTSWTMRHCVPDRTGEASSVAFRIRGPALRLPDVRFPEGDQRAAHIAILDEIIAFYEANKPQR